MISVYIRQSSVNSLTDDLTAARRLLMWCRNRIGPNTVPCGTPDCAPVWFEYSPSSWTLIFLSIRKEDKNMWVLPLILYWRFYGGVRGIASRTSEKSGITSPLVSLCRRTEACHGLLLLAAICMSSLSRSHDLVMLIWFFSRYWIICLCLVCFSTLHSTEVKDTGQ